MPDACVFCRIVRGEIPAAVIHEDAEFLAFRDIHPRAPVHAVVVTKQHYPTLLDMTDAAYIGRYMLAAAETARALGLAPGGFRLVANCGPDGGQEVPHVHVHVMGGRYLGWPPG
jgi:histidine triad (HIT) family protein